MYSMYGLLHYLENMNEPTIHYAPTNNWFKFELKSVIKYTVIYCIVLYNVFYDVVDVHGVYLAVSRSLTVIALGTYF